MDLKEISLAQLIKRGGIYYKVPGSTCGEIMANIIEKLKDNLIPGKKEAFLQAVMEREALISTGMENGIALPHPRTPMLDEGEDPFAAIAFPVNSPSDWSTPDNSGIHTVFLIVSKTPKQHLGVLSRISFLCQQEQFLKLVSKRAPKEKIIAAIEKAESGWRSF
jgi:PTS system nitrogen regulatory IIA component